MGGALVSKEAAVVVAGAPTTAAIALALPGVAWTTWYCLIHSSLDLLW